MRCPRVLRTAIHMVIEANGHVTARSSSLSERDDRILLLYSPGFHLLGSNEGRMEQPPHCVLGS
jgi:hypothetical protein